MEHVAPVSWKPAEVASVSPERATELLVLVTVMDCEALVWPIPVTAKVSVEGKSVAEPAWPPSPARATTAEGYVEEETVSVPEKAPLAGGVKVRETVQVEPEPRETPQVVEEMPKGEAVMMARPAAAREPELVTVTVCAELVLPMTATEKLSCDGLTLRPAGDCPVPASAT